MEILSNMVSIIALIIVYGFIRRWEKIKHEEGEKYKNKTEVYNLNGSILWVLNSIVETQSMLHIGWESNNRTFVDIDKMTYKRRLCSLFKSLQEIQLNYKIASVLQQNKTSVQFNSLMFIIEKEIILTETEEFEANVNITKQIQEIINFINT